MTRLLVAALCTALLTAPAATGSREASCVERSGLAADVMTLRQRGAPRTQLGALSRSLSPVMRLHMDQMIEAAWATLRQDDPEGHDDMIHHFAEEIFDVCTEG